MQRPPHIGVTDPPDRSRSIELLVAALLRRPAVQRPRAEDTPRETAQSATPPK